MAESNKLTDDLGVAVKGHVCQNFEAHPDEEVKMRSGPYVGVICPECGRAAGGGDGALDVPYVDPEGEGGDALAVVALPKATWDVVIHGLQEEMAQLKPEGEWIGKYPEEGGVVAMEQAVREIGRAIRDGDGDG